MTDKPTTTTADKHAAGQPTPSEDSPNLLQSLWSNVLHRLNPPPNADMLREVVEELIEEPASQSGLTTAERILLGNIIKLREKRVGDCMVPRAETVAVDADTSMKDLVAVIVANNYSRLPVYRETLDDVIGMIHVKDLVPLLAQGGHAEITEILRPVQYVAPSMPVSRLLLQMRQTRQHMAMVIDEFGGIDGLVTIEDLVEEIVGEIDDEHDMPDAPGIIRRSDGTLLVDARLTIGAFEAQTGLSLPSPDGEEIDTLGGYVTHLTGRVPHVGETVTAANGLVFDVLELDQSRVSRLRIRTARKPAPTV